MLAINVVHSLLTIRWVKCGFNLTTEGTVMDEITLT